MSAQCRGYKLFEDGAPRIHCNGCADNARLLAEAVAVLRETASFFGLPSEKAELRKRQVTVVERFDDAATKGQTP